MKRWSFLLLILWAFLGFSQEYSFLNYSVEDGLPQSQVTSFAQDENGYLWIGTMGGLAQYNGLNFVNYTIKDKIFSNRITSLDIENDSLLVGHEDGISIRYHRQFTSYTFPKESSTIIVSKILHFKNKLYIFTNGSGYYTLSDKKIEHFRLRSPDQNRIRTALVFNNRLYLGTREGIMESTDGIHFSIVKSTQFLNISGLHIYDKEQFVYTTFNSEIGFINLKTFLRKSIPTPHYVYGLRNCLVTAEKEIWIPHLEGIIHIDKHLKISYINQNSGLNYENINVIFEDKNQTIWIGTEGKGIYKFSGNHITIFRFKKETKSGIALSSFESNTDFIFGTYDGDLIFQNKKNLQTKVFPSRLGAIWSIAKESDNIYLLATQEGPFHFNRITQHFSPITDTNQNTIGKSTAIFRQKNQSVYIAGEFGLATYRNKQIEKIYADKKVSTIRSIVQQNDKIYIGSDNGLFLFKNGQFTPSFNFKNKINSLFCDAFQQLWIGTDEGLFLLRGSTIQQITISQHAASDLINFINSDGIYLILGTNDGIYYAPISQKQWKFKNIGLEEGISNLETNINSSFITRSKELLFGTASGLNRLNIRKFERQKNIQRPMLILKSVDINFLPIQKYPQLKATYSTDHVLSSIELPYNKNNILISIDGVSLNNHSSLAYQYRIIGMEENWSPKFTNPQINLTNLPNGNYQIQIRAINLNENVTSPIIYLQVTIRPPFYLTYWFISFVILFVIASIYLFIKLRIKHIHKSNHQYRAAMEGRLSQLEQQSLNASMNRHFIFNSLNSIQYYINTQDRYTANKYLSDFAKLIRKNLDASSSHQNVVLLSEEIERLKLYLSLELMRFKGRFEYVIDETDVITEHYYVPPMLLQPFVENSIIHGILPNQEKMGKISIIIQDFMTHLEIKIKDNGIGINHSREMKSTINKDHISKGVELTSNRIVLLKELYGEDFELIGPYQTKDENGSISGTTVLIKIPKQNLAD